MQSHRRSEMQLYDQISNGLGWFSIGLGLAEVAAPSQLARFIGIADNDKNRGVLRAFGLREIIAGVGILSQPRASRWMWSRVGGDLLDLAALTKAMNHETTDRTRAGAATAAVVGVTALDMLCAQKLGETDGVDPGAVDSGRRHITKAIYVHKPVHEVYSYWRDFERLPTFMRHLESVRGTGDRRSHWIAKAPFGRTVEWDAEITADVPNREIAWRSTGGDIENSGRVRFEEAMEGQGTQITVDLEYAPPGGAIGAQLARLLGEEPERQVYEDLRAFKQIMELGEVVASDASIHEGMHPGQPVGVA